MTPERATATKMGVGKGTLEEETKNTNFSAKSPAKYQI